MATTPTVHAITSRIENDAREVLEEAKGKDFETVIVIGFKAGNVYWQKSTHADTVTVIGALEMAKQMLFAVQEDA